MPEIGSKFCSYVLIAVFGGLMNLCACAAKAGTTHSTPARADDHACCKTNTNPAAPPITPQSPCEHCEQMKADRTVPDRTVSLDTTLPTLAFPPTWLTPVGFEVFTLLTRPASAHGPPVARTLCDLVHSGCQLTV